MTCGKRGRTAAYPRCRDGRKRFEKEKGAERGEEKTRGEETVILKKAA